MSIKQNNIFDEYRRNEKKIDKKINKLNIEKNLNTEKYIGKCVDYFIENPLDLKLIREHFPLKLLTIVKKVLNKRKIQKNDLTNLNLWFRLIERRFSDCFFYKDFFNLLTKEDKIKCSIYNCGFSIMFQHSDFFSDFLKKEYNIREHINNYSANYLSFYGFNVEKNSAYLHITLTENEINFTNIIENILKLKNDYKSIEKIIIRTNGNSLYKPTIDIKNLNVTLNGKEDNKISFKSSKKDVKEALNECLCYAAKHHYYISKERKKEISKIKISDF